MDVLEEVLHGVPVVVTLLVEVELLEDINVDVKVAVQMENVNA